MCTASRSERSVRRTIAPTACDMNERLNSPPMGSVRRDIRGRCLCSASKLIVPALLTASAAAAPSVAATPRSSSAGHEMRAVQQAGERRVRARPSGPLVLLLPGGGWQHAEPQTMSPWVRDFQEYGIRARAITYPLRDVLGAIRHVRDVVAAEPGPVILYGISAGGTIASALAATGEVAGAVNVAGPTDFTRWISPGGLLIMNQIHMTRSDRQNASPYWRLNGHQSPQLIQCGLVDPIVTYDQCARFAAAARAAQPDTELQPMVNAHGQFAPDMRAARAWISTRWPTSSPGPRWTTALRSGASH